MDLEIESVVVANQYPPAPSSSNCSETEKPTTNVNYERVSTRLPHSAWRLGKPDYRNPARNDTQSPSVPPDTHRRHLNGHTFTSMESSIPPPPGMFRQMPQWPVCDAYGTVMNLNHLHAAGSNMVGQFDPRWVSPRSNESGGIPIPVRREWPTQSSSNGSPATSSRKRENSVYE